MKSVKTRYTYHCMPMHLHAGHEPDRTRTQPGASMESHIYRASQLGMRYIRITDHDVRMGRKRCPADDFDFSRGMRQYKDASGGELGWETEGSPVISFDGTGMRLSASSASEEWECSGVYFISSGKRHTVSLLADVVLHLGLDFAPAADTRLLLDVQLSQRPPEMTPAHLIYAFGDWQTDDPHSIVIPVTPSADGRYALNVSADAPVEKVGGKDNVFDTLRVVLATRRGAQAHVRLDSLHIEHPYGFDEVLCRQRALARTIGQRYGIETFVTSEISGAGHHKNCFSSCVPCIDYEACGYKITQVEAAAHVKRHGGIFAYNHPFVKTETETMTPAQVSEIVARYASEFIASRLWGAVLMEVGFPVGRYGFTIGHYLQLWDLMSLAGVFITGYGDSDAHSSGARGWFTGNNFASWTAADADIPFPVPEEVFNDSLQAGRLYMGDPVFLQGAVEFSAGSGEPMGAVIPIKAGDNAPRSMTLRVQEAKPGWRMRIVVDGEEAASMVLDGEKVPDLTYSFEVSPTRVVSFARAELYSAEGRCIMVTNPIYLVKTDEYAGELPEARLYTEE